MGHTNILEFPLKNPIPILALLLLLILVVPLILKKLKIPGIVGLIVAGVMIGPHGYNLVARDGSVVMLGTVGLIYIMFLAGMELDISQIKSNKARSITFGAFTFFIPLILGVFVSHYMLGYGYLASILIALMFSTHTLVAFPIAGRLGITKSESVNIAVSGTIITDTTVLLCLGVFTNYAQGNLNGFFWLKLILSFAAFSATVLWIFPKLSKWFFKNIEEENYSQFIYVFTIIVVSAMLAELAGVEPIIGAFFAGLALNRLIPHGSALMSRVQFIGNSLFIPIFLISVGMLVDLSILFKGFDALYVAFILTFMALISKWLAAYFTQIIFKFNSVERNIIFGLSSSHAAATIAIILIGFNLGVLDAKALNGTILLILCTCLVASFVTENEGRKLAIQEAGKKKATVSSPLKILVPCGNPANYGKLIDFAMMCKHPGSVEPIFPLSVWMDEKSLTNNLDEFNKHIDKYAKKTYPGETRITPTSRVDTNIADGIIRASKEMSINTLILGRSERTKASELILGNLLDHILESTNKTVFVCRNHSPINLSDKIHVFVPANSEYEVGFEKWLTVLTQIANNASATVVFNAPLNVINRIKHSLKNTRELPDAEFNIANIIEDFYKIVENMDSEDFIFVVAARNKSISYDYKLEEFIDKTIINFENYSVSVIYPEQHSVGAIEDLTKYDIMDSSLIEENINLIARIGKYFINKFKS